MKIYLVGGAVRDELLNWPVKERDWVVVNATVADMLALNYQQVGKEFPVFIHPKTGDEYALARMERKVKPGYQGFSFDTSANVTLEEDLKRRDLTINAIAKDLQSNTIIDPYHGQEDLKNKVLRHVSPAFAEDPVRILRTARFLARYAHLGFKLAPETLNLMQQMVTNGEVNALVPERVWKELERALCEKNPEAFFQVLADCHALPILFKEIEMGQAGMSALQAAEKITPDATVRFAALLYTLDKHALSSLCRQYRVPNAFQELASLTSLHHLKAHQALSLSSEAILDWLSALDIFRREERFQLYLLACEAITRSQGKTLNSEWIMNCANAAKAVDVQELLSQGLNGKDLALKIKEKRLEKIELFRRA